MKILSLFILSTAFLCNAHAVDDQRPLSKRKTAIIENVINSPSFSDKRLPSSFEQQFERDSVKVKNAIATFFQDSGELKSRLTDFDNAYRHGKLLFQEQEDGTVHSRNMVLVYFSYAALMSNDTIYYGQEYRSPKIILDQLTDSSPSDRFFKSNLLCLPLLSKKGHLTLEEINLCYSHSIAVIGVPYGNHNQNTFDTSTGASPLEFAGHDSQHAGQYLLPALDTLFFDGQSWDYAFQRRQIYATMQKNSLTRTFAVPYFLTFHEYGIAASLNYTVNLNPIQNTIDFLNKIYTPASNQRDHIINSILKNTNGFLTLHSEDMGTSNENDAVLEYGCENIIITERDDIVLNEEDFTKIYQLSYNVYFNLKNQPNKTFLLSDISYTQMLEEAVDLAKLLNVYGAGLNIPEDITHFNMNAFIHTISKGLNDFNKAYGHFFDAV